MELPVAMPNRWNALPLVMNAIPVVANRGLNIWRKLRPMQRSFVVMVVALLFYLWRKQRELRFILLMRYRAPTPNVKTTYVRMKMEDGVRLATSVYVPKTDKLLKTCVIRTPYSRQALQYMAEPMFLSGVAVILQDVRGRFASEGNFDLLSSDKNDSITLLQWIEKQEWASGEIISIGWSFMGVVQYPLVSALLEGKRSGVLSDKVQLKGMSLAFAASSLLKLTYTGGCLNYEASYTYLRLLVDYQRWADLCKPHGLFVDRRMSRMWKQQPKSTEEIRTKFYQNLPPQYEALVAIKPHIEHISFWKSRDFRYVVPEIPCPTLNWAAWHDPFLLQQMDDFMHYKGTNHYIIIGQWAHADLLFPILLSKWLRESVPWLLNPEKPFVSGPGEASPDDRVTLYVMHAYGEKGEWKRFPAWPPINIPLIFTLCQGGQLVGGDEAQKVPLDLDEGCIHYDPSNPTPSVGGAIFSLTAAGIMDQAERESRRDVLTFTTQPLRQAVEIIGYVEAELNVVAPSGADMFLCLCDVDPSGVSRNVCDGIMRLEDRIKGSKSCSPLHTVREEGSLPNQCVSPTARKRTVTIQLGPTAKRFPAGHSIRLQVSCGAYPRYQRAFGGLNDAQNPRVIEPFEVFLEPYGNRITLPSMSIHSAVAKRDSLRKAKLRKTMSAATVQC